MQLTRWRSWILAVLAVLAPLALPAAEADANAVTSAGATDDAVTAIRKFRAAPGMKIELFASEPMIRNVVSFAFDEHGRCYVVESNRRRTSVFDIRGLGEWLDNDFSFRTVQDRANFFKNTFSPTNTGLGAFLKKKRNLLSDFNHDGTIDWHDLEVETERIRLLVDTNADGRADSAVTLAEGFDGITSGVAAGVLARKGEMWFTCIPDLWKMSNDELRMTSGIPKLEAPANPHVRHPSSVLTNLLAGFGVHIAFGGHDMHGLKMGPDGKIYFSIADRGTGTNLWDKIVDKWPGLTMEALADSGGVFRCNQDGTEFEVVCIGLRNPQELAFDEFGNLFAGENNADGGDKARWIHIVEGADYGWRMGWQWLPKLGAWNSEMLWGMADKNTSAYYLPPVAHIGAGPAGIAYYPGTGLPARYDRHFFMCDFRGGPNSVVRSFALRPKGASFEAFDESDFLTGPLCTDVDFGVDGAVYVSDWVKGWDKTDKARIYRVFDPSTLNDPAVLEVKKLLGEGMEKRSNEELARLLGHRDMRVRLEAQWELAERIKSDRDPAVPLLVSAALKSDNRLARLHAIWSLGQVARHLPTEQLIKELNTLFALLEDKDSLIRAHACDLFQSAALLNAQPAIGQLLLDKEPSVRRSAALALSRPFSLHGDYRLSQSVSEKINDAVGPKVDTLRNSITGSRGMRGTKSFTWSFPRAELMQMLTDADKGGDAYLRHAGVQLLSSRYGATLNPRNRQSATAISNALNFFVTNQNNSVRLAGVLMLRRLQRPEIAQFLNDSDPQIVLEAARAINDAPIPEALPELAKHLTGRAALPRVPDRNNNLANDEMRPTKSDATIDQGRAATRPYHAFALRRALNAHFRLGADENAQALADFAASDAPDALRTEALELLALWPKPPGRDHVVGLWRPLPSREGAVAAKALEKVLPQIESGGIESGGQFLLS